MTPRSRPPKCLSAVVVVATLVLVALAFGRQALALNADALQLERPIGSTPKSNQSCLENQPRQAGNALLDLVNARLAWMPAVAQSKWILDLPVEDEARERDVLASAVAEVNKYADELNQPPPSQQTILNFYSAQIEAAKTLQRRWMNQQAILPRSNETTTDRQRQQARDRLDNKIRPSLLALGKQMASLIVQRSSNPRRPNAQAIASCLQHHALPQEQIQELIQALSVL